jgi:3-hydroxyisobutyrate dehydrogenase-like beta-hydroxyacid dehydrogenase
MTSSSLPIAGFIGLGDQGPPMATGIVEAGNPLHVEARRPSSLDGPREQRTSGHPGLATLAAASDITGLCVSTDEGVTGLLNGGLPADARPGTVIVNHGTGTPAQAVRMAELCQVARVDFLDARVSGGRAGAEERTLPTMAGGSESAYAICEATRVCS